MTENEPVNAEAKKRDLYERQKLLLIAFPEHGAISRAQVDKPLEDYGEDGRETKRRTKGLTKRQGTACGHAAINPAAARDCTFKSEENAGCSL